ncbi:hypothetical protein CTI12_AA321690 [Artemisia annua]|uniref:Uncharacterized protein n=1 Tax=Artemisia annua TaxID=35608 RepID=A0A2U1N052_ARTAN|nr:hypothetical protein CTI12_AA321690 [Artemisia annua]
MGLSPVSMEKLPETLLLEILSHLDDSADVARCRIASKGFNNVYPYIRSINLQRTSRIYLNLGSRVSNSSQVSTHFEDIFLNLVSNLKVVETINISNDSLIEDLPHGFICKMTGDLYLTDDDFVKKWLPTCSSQLKSLSISDSPVSSFPRSHLLPLISVYCHNLVELKVKRALLSVKNLNPMPMLTSLTLEAVHVCGEDINVISNCFPNLQALNLKYCEGDTYPATIDLLNLKTFGLTMYDAPSSVNALSSISLIAPNLIMLELDLSGFTALHVKAPILSHLHLTVDLRDGIVHELHIGYSQYFLHKVFCVFPNVNSLCFKSNAWMALEAWYKSKPFDWETCDGMKGLKTFSAYLWLSEQSWTFLCVANLLDQSTDLSEVSLLIWRGVSPRVSKSFIVRCMSRWPRLKWRWGIWSDGMEDSWVSI